MTIKEIQFVTIGCYYCQEPLMVEEAVVKAVCKKCMSEEMNGMAKEQMMKEVKE